MWVWIWPWCWACVTCSGAPDWPAQGQVHEAWVREAIAWRMQVGLEGCPEVVPALDAWTLEWLSQSEEVHVDVKTADWPFLAYAPELQTVLVQRLALVELANVPSRQVDVVKDVRRVAKRSDEDVVTQLVDGFECVKCVYRPGGVLGIRNPLGQAG